MMAEGAATDSLGEEATGEAIPGSGMGAEGGDAGGVLDSLVEGAETQDGSGEGNSQDSESMKLILDKLDTIIDFLVGQGDAQSAVGEVPGEGQVSTEVPATIKSELITAEVDYSGLEKTVSEAVLKSLQSSETNINISSESLESFANTLKSVLAGIEDRVVEKVLTKIDVEKTTMKSISKDEIKIVNPGVRLDSQVDKSEKTVDVIKSIEEGNQQSTQELEEDIILKGLVEEFVSIVGSSPVQAQKRAQIKLKAFEELNLNKFEFANAVSAYEKSKKNNK
jgi:hypothetical protein